MDDSLARLILMTEMLRPLVLEELIKFGLSCDLCNNIPKNTKLIKCIFCDKMFCSSCCGKENTRICYKCNLAIAKNINKTDLDKFGLKELRYLSENYNLSLKNILEKEELIEAILINFKKSVRPNKEGLNVSELKKKMDCLTLEESFEKEKNRREEENKLKIFADYSHIPNEKESLTVDFCLNDSIDILEKDIPTLPVAKLKEFLDRFNVNYIGMRERNELVSMAITLHQAFTKFKNDQNNTATTNKELKCNSCKVDPISCVFIFCGHSTCCFECGSKLSKCPVCSRNVDQCFKIIIG